MNNSECLKCGAKLLHLLESKELKCSECGNTASSNTVCPNGHFICDTCHAKQGIKYIIEEFGKSESKNPINLLRKAMNSEYVHMHGNEHHVLVGAALIAAYHNSGGQVDLNYALSEMNKRGSKYPGGSCGFWGACGAAVSTGMYMSIVTGATPLTNESWSFANRATSEALSKMADIGGPRCCKRNSFIAVETAARLTKKLLNIEMEMPENIVCSYHGKNNQCIEKRCPYYPV